MDYAGKSLLNAQQCAQGGVGAVSTMVAFLVQALLTAQCDISREELWPADFGEQALKHGLDEYDFVVIGAGTAGSVLASRLSENPDWRVLVLEAGGNPPPESEVPSLAFTIMHTNYTYNYFTEPNGHSCLGLKGERCYWPRGKMLGGSGAINANVFLPGNRRDYDNWKQLGLDNWGWDNVAPYFSKMLHVEGNESHPIGHVRLHIANADAITYDQKLIIEAAKELGWREIERYEEGSYVGYTLTATTLGGGRRQSTGKTYLAKVASRPNLHVIKNAQVTRLQLDTSGTRVESINFVLRGEKEMSVRVRKEALLSAGTIDSAKLLMLSGIGPRQHLNKLNIPVAHNLPVGENLQDHLMVIVLFKVNENEAPILGGKDQLDAIYQYLIHSRGPLTGAFSFTGFIQSDPSATNPYPDLEVHYFFFRRGDIEGLRTITGGLGFKDSIAQAMTDALKSSDIIISVSILAHPKSVGRLQLKSADYKENPIIHANYLDSDQDIEVLVKAMRHQKSFEQTKAFAEQNAQILRLPLKECDLHPYQSNDYWRCYIRHIGTTIYHHVGTVKMGASNDPTACVDERLRLRGVENLRVADASVMPAVTSINTNAPTIMIAERAAEFIKEDWRSLSGSDTTTHTPEL